MPKLLLILFLLFVSQKSSSQPLWKSVSRFPEQGLANVVVTDSMHIKGRPITSYSQFVYSNDGGLSWNSIQTNFPLFKFSFTDALHGWACSDSGRICRTLDGGISWTAIQLNSDPYFSDLQFVSDSTGFVFSANYDTIFITHDAGDNWDSSITNIPWGSYQKKIYFKDALNGWIMNGYYDSLIYHTIDGGINWTADSLPSPMGGYANNGISFVDSLTGFLTGRYSLMKTMDGGLTWTVVGNVSGGDIAFRDSLNGILVSSNELIFQTTNGGISWAMVYQTPLFLSVNNFPRAFVSDGSFYEFNNAGALLKSNDGTNWKYITWNTFPRSYGNSEDPQLAMSSAKNGIFVSASDCTPGSCGNSTFYTTDSGFTWHQFDYLTWNTAIQTKSDTEWYFVDSYSLTSNTILYESNDQMQTYSQIYSFNDRIRYINFADSLHAVAAGYNTYYSQDGGLTWSMATGINATSCFNGTFPDAKYGWMIRYNKLARTNDYGATWNVIYTDPSFQNYFKKVIFTDTLHGFIAHQNAPSFEMTIDGGNTWTTLNSPGYIYDFYMTDSLTGWVSTDSGIFYSNDGLLSFQLQYDLPVSNLLFLDEVHGYAAASNLFLSTDQTSIINNIISVSEKETPQVDIYPNPGNNIFHIRVHEGLPILNFKVFDQLGREIIAVKMVDNPESEFDLKYISAGTYFISIQLSNGSMIHSKIHKID